VTTATDSMFLQAKLHCPFDKSLSQLATIHSSAANHW